MSDQSHGGDDRALGARTPPAPGQGPPPMPRWVKILGLILVAILLIAGLVMLLSGDEHGPRRHGALPGPITAATASFSR